MIDNHPIELEAMELFKQGKSKEAWKLQWEFLKEVKGSGEDHCSCPTKCPLHGKCMECVAVHRGHGDHLPNCFNKMAHLRLEKPSG